MARRKSTARAPKQKRTASTSSARPNPPPTKPAQQANANVPAVPSRQPTKLAEQRSPGLFGQMASTAAGVAVGHSIGHGITGLFSGGSSSETPASQDSQSQYTPQTQDVQPQYQAYQNDSYGGASCEKDAKALTKCLELNNHNISLCQYYLENLKACQQMASQF
ncbi:CHCH domain-containing protein [Rhizophagus irregularis]|uniref:CHCH domain-containing protein n=3 Tax=Rhizophagus irregularis TaxID=588596 RepID=A0A2I1DS38_9GLOM|nr:hypothetical protein GLOIN_2v1605283 [Rhizophagus irregularis DAOM 181602=DAOM 197198]EXX75143.1 Mic17p [Rhizophagus irregularis DAOM 197198w]PKC05838.1 CHCH domain-containing protein [Rhizophagus irregularis]PKC62649.1 CHCH domain-containing protein [Rhizophagus irregularis]PKK80345.1 CHCH domain-containing protein [Rhizophagus irregularis]PKY12704.1 CHCH domain-containing protein [Rhizophagus irregularis]|eukprot:XP_025178247.1 hypothetical protein GLOIN_2v1605283 [Rhizophagus irregularis DAOM 181602=DAOM 197198]